MESPGYNKHKPFGASNSDSVFTYEKENYKELDDDHAPLVGVVSCRLGFQFSRWTHDTSHL